MSPFIASKMVRSPFNLFNLVTQKANFQTSQFKGASTIYREKNSMSHQKVSQLFAFIFACEVFELSRAKKQNEVETNSRPSNARFFRTQQFQSARKRWQTSRDWFFFGMVESQSKVNQNQCNLRSPSMLNF